MSRYFTAMWLSLHWRKIFKSYLLIVQFNWLSWNGMECHFLMLQKIPSQYLPKCESCYDFHTSRFATSVATDPFTHPPRTIWWENLQTFSSAFYARKMFDFRFRFHWGLFLRVQLTVNQHYSSGNGLAPNRRQAITWPILTQLIDAHLCGTRRDGLKLFYKTQISSK